MDSSQTLNLRQVAQLIKRSTKSVRNYIKAGKLKANKIESVNGPEYTFHVNDVVSFAKEFLGVTLVMGEATAMDQDEIEKNSSSSEKELDAEIPVNNTLPTIPFHDRKLDLGQFTQVLLSLENDKMKLLEEFGEYKARLAYKVGQLESQVKQLETDTNEKDNLKKKVSELEKSYRIRDMDARQLLAMKNFYEGRPWWKFWQKYELQDSEKLI